MTEAAGGGRGEVERGLTERSLQDDAFRQRLLEDPKAVVKQELGTRLPEGVQGVGLWGRPQKPSTWFSPAPRLQTKAASSRTRS